jgi:DNA adenine methylase
MNTTPLRYPGGKSIMSPFFEELIMLNSLKNVIYSEPYAGGAGAAINLLLNNSVEAIQINDASRGIFSFWNSLINEGERFLDKVYKTDVTLKEWQSQRLIFKNPTTSSFDLAFATFFLSRTNRSGILAAGPIGGQDEKKQQDAKYKIDCRFNKFELIERLQKIIDKRDKIFVSNLDALVFLKQIRDENAFVYLDPPYYCQGKALYLNYYNHDDHVFLANFLRNSANFHWVLSYDSVPEILELYSGFNLYEFILNYTAQDSKKGTELLTHSAGISFHSITSIKKATRKKEIELLRI